MFYKYAENHRPETVVFFCADRVVPYQFKGYWAMLQLPGSHHKIFFLT